MRRLDRFIIHSVQDVYLWIFDRTGLCVGTLALTLPVLAIILGGHGLGWFEMLYLSYMALVSWVLYSDQMNNRIELFNARAERNRMSMGRRVLNIIVVYGIIQDVVRLHPTHLVGWLGWLAFSYVMVIQIRKREPPEHLEFAKQGAAS